MPEIPTPGVGFDPINSAKQNPGIETDLGQSSIHTLVSSFVTTALCAEHRVLYDSVDCD
jgi:hypothetical protein